MSTQNSDSSNSGRDGNNSQNTNADYNNEKHNPERIISINIKTLSGKVFTLSVKRNVPSHLPSLLFLSCVEENETMKEMLSERKRQEESGWY